MCAMEPIKQQATTLRTILLDSFKKMLQNYYYKHERIITNMSVLRHQPDGLAVVLKIVFLSKFCLRNLFQKSANV